MDAEKMEQSKKEQFKNGVTVALLLAALTAGEFYIAVAGGSLGNIGTVLMLVALLKAFLVVRDYMHVGRVLSGGEEH